jgi:hypothetical protein
MKTLLTNGKIYTANQEHIWADSLVIEEDRIIFVGRVEDAPKTDNCLDLLGKSVIPGIIDSHIHPGMVSQSSWHIKLPWTENAEELLEFIRAYVAKHPKEEVPFLYFEYYPTSMFDTNGPTKEMLDSACNDRPCYCQDFGEHLHWMNSKMLELMEVTKDTSDPVPGLEIFVRDEMGNPTGWCKEFAWVHFQDKMFEKIGWTPPTQLTPSLMAPFFEFLTRHGITSVADGLLEGEDQILAMQDLDRQGRLNVYYDGDVRFWSLADLPEKIAELQRYQEKYSCKHMKFNTMKLFLDGTNESGNSASLHPFLNDPSGTNFGEIKMDTDELAQCFLICNRNGLDLHIHMVGDRAFRTGCDAVEKAQKEAETLGETWVCEPIFAHCEVIDPEDMERPARLGITVNWSCHWSGGYFGEVAQEFYGYEKWARMYQFNPILKSGALVTFSSDVVSFYELHRADPFFSMEIANTRIDPEFPLDPEKYLESIRPPISARIGIGDLLPGYTISGAKQMHWDEKLGSLEAGKIANFNILSANPFEAEPMKLHEIYCEKVFFEGNVIWEAGKD